MLLLLLLLLFDALGSVPGGMYLEMTREISLLRTVGPGAAFS
jgi:hypothetical protein